MLFGPLRVLEALCCQPDLTFFFCFFFSSFFISFELRSLFRLFVLCQPQFEK